MSTHSTHSNAAARSTFRGLVLSLDARDRRRVGIAIGVVAAASLVEVAAIVMATVALTEDAPLWPAFLLAAVWVLVSSLGVMASRGAGYSLAEGLLERVRCTLISLPYGWFRTDRRGDLATLTTGDVMQAMSIPAHLLPRLIPAVIVPCSLAVLLTSRDLLLGGILWVLLLFCWGAAVWGRAMVAASDGRLHEAQELAASAVIEFARLQPTLRLASAQSFGRQRIDTALDRVRDDTARMIRLVLPGVTVFAFMVQLTIALSLVVAVVHGVHSGQSGIAIVLNILLLLRCIEPLRGVAELAAALRMARNAVQRLLDFFATPQLQQDPERAAQPPKINPETGNPAAFSLEHASMHYPSSTSGVDDLTLDFDGPGLVAVVGASGSGKTTLLSLLARFGDVDSGTVHLMGRDVRGMSVEDISAHVSVVFQDTYLLNTSIRDNIALARPSASAAEIEHVMDMCGVEDLARHLEDGVDTVVGEGGERLSGGERQRVAIARALLKQAPVVLLDEVTSALDAFQQRIIMQAIEQLRQDSTVVMAAHRLSTVVSADCIVVMDSGRIVDAGTYSELLSRCSTFQAMHSSSAERGGDSRS